MMPEANGNDGDRGAPEGRWYPRGGWDPEGEANWEGELDAGSRKLLRAEIEKFPSVEEAESFDGSMLKLGDKVQFIDTDGEWIEGSAKIVDIKRNTEDPEETYFLVKSDTVEGLSIIRRFVFLRGLKVILEGLMNLPNQSGCQQKSLLPGLLLIPEQNRLWKKWVLCWLWEVKSYLHIKIARRWVL